MPGVPLDAFAQVKKGLRGMFRKKSAPPPEGQEAYIEPTTTQDTEAAVAPTATTSAASESGATPSAATAAPVEIADAGNAEPAKLPVVECTRGQEAALAAETKEGNVLNTTISPLDTSATTTASEPNGASTSSSTAPNVLVTPPSAEEPHGSFAETTQQETDNVADKSGATPVNSTNPTSTNMPVEDESIPPQTSSTERPKSSEPPKMHATSGPLEDHPTFA